MNVLIDTDPGGDDAVALMWLASLMHQGRLRIAGVSTTAGNVDSTRTFRNAAGILALCGLDEVPLGVGPPVHMPRDAAAVHGEDGLGNLAPTLPEVPLQIDLAPSSAQLLGKLLRNSDAPAHLLAAGPLTNLSLTDASLPGVLQRAESLIVMGGALGRGNVTHSAEFNFFYDPESAARVLAARRLTQLVTLDVSQTLRLSLRRVESIVGGFRRSPVTKFFTALCRFMSGRDARLHGEQAIPGFAVHDAAIVAWLAYPELFRSRPCRVSVDPAGSATPGRLRESGAPGSSACLIATEVAAGALMTHLADDLRTLFAGA